MNRMLCSCVCWAVVLAAPPLKPVERRPAVRPPLRARAVTELVVSRTARPKQEGRFRTIRGALEHAAARKLAGVRVTVHGGTYTENLQVTRPTHIAAAGGRAVVIRGSVMNSGGHELTLKELSIRDASPFGLVQSGGKLTLEGVEISGTRRTPRDPQSGLALDVSDGAEGRLSDLTLEDNQGMGLLVRGAATRVRVMGLTVRNNSINPLMFERYLADGAEHARRLAAVEVADGALLLVEHPVIERNAFQGVVVRDGARAHLRSGRVSRTRAHEHEGGSRGGICVAARYRARLELRNITISHAGLGGLQNIRSWVTARDMVVSDSPVGVNLQGRAEPSYDPSACIVGYGNRFIDNDTDLDADELHVPAATNPLAEGEPEPGPDCPGVPWDFN